MKPIKPFALAAASTKGTSAAYSRMHRTNNRQLAYCQLEPYAITFTKVSP